MKKVFFVSQAANLYGSERGLLGLLTHWPECEWSPVVVCPNGPLTREVERLGFPWERMQFGGFGWLRRPDWQVRFLWRYLRVLARHRPTVVVLNYEGNVPLLVVGARMSGVPVVRMLKREVRPPQSTSYRMAPRDRWAFRACSGVVCISGAVERQLREVLALPEEFPAVTLYDPQAPVEIPADAVAKRRAALGLTPEAIVVGLFARVEPLKGVDTLIRAAALVVKDVPQARFLVVGGDDGSAAGKEYAGRLAELARECAVDGHFIWSGFVSDPQTVMAACDAVALPTRADGLGRVLIEAWAVERPVVASDTGGPGEVVALSGGGLLHPVGDHEALAAHLVRLLRDGALRAQLGARGRDWIVRTTDPTRYAEQFVRLLDRFTMGRATS